MLTSSKMSLRQTAAQPAKSSPTVPGHEPATEPNPRWQSLALHSFGVHPKLAVSQPGDPYEQEADRVADQVMRMTAQRSSEPKLSFSTFPFVKTQRKCDQCDDEEEKKLQRKPQGHNAHSSLSAPPIVHEALNSPGRPLDPITRSFMEERFGQDFSRVRTHTDASSAESARAVEARAYTVGRDIVFSKNAYMPETTTGRALLAHELAHVVQKDRGAPALIYRNGHRDRTRVERALRQATSTLSASVRFLPTQQLQALVNSMVSVLSGFFPTGHGRMDQRGAITRQSRGIWLDTPVAHGGLTAMYRHELSVYLSEENCPEDASYESIVSRTSTSSGGGNAPGAASASSCGGNAPGGASALSSGAMSGGQIRIFVHNVARLSDAELIATLAHELVHLFTDVISRAQLFAIRLRTTQPALPGAAAGGRPVSVSIDLADVTLGAHSRAFRGGPAEERRLRFESQRLALHRPYQSVVNFLNQQRAGRGAPPFDPVAVSGTWVARTTDELLAYIIDRQVDIAVQLLTSRGPGGGRVAFTVPLDPLVFFRVYAGRHWLTDPQDQAALRLPAAEPILRQAGNSPEMRAVYRTLEEWVMQSTP